jgi:putative membrane protein
MRTTRLTVLLAGTLLASLPIAQGTAQVRVTTSTGEVSIYTEKNLTDHMIVVDSVELEMAQLAVSRTQNTAVRDFANMLINEHTGHLESVRKIAAEDDVGRQASAADTAGAAAIRALTSLREMPADSGFDKAFIAEQIRLHSQEIIAMKMFGGAAEDDDLQDEVKKTLPVLERHLARAKEVAATLGMSVDTTATPKSDTTMKKPTTTTTKP